MTASMPDFANLDPPGQPGETIAWCPLCGEVIIRRAADARWDPYAEEEVAADHMLMMHEMTPDVAQAALMQAVKQ